MTSTNATPAAVIYCPALNETEPSKVIDGVAQRLARTLDHHSDPVGTTYRVRTAAPEDYGAQGRTEVREVLRVDPGKNPETEGVVTHRVYLLNYLPLLDDQSASANILLRTANLLWQCVKMTARFVTACVVAESFSKKQKLSVFVGGLALAGVLLYTALAVGTLARIVYDAWNTPPAATATAVPVAPAASASAPPMLAPAVGSPAPLPRAVIEPVRVKPTDPAARAWDTVKQVPGRFWDWVCDWAERIWRWLGSAKAKTIAVLGAVGLSVSGLRTLLDRNVTLTLRFCRYLDEGPARASCTGKFNALLEHVLESNPSRVDVVAYSLGSLVALDSLYPPQGCPNTRVGNVSTLTTIGCPFDFVRTFWDEYFDGRTSTAPKLKWLNVYSPVDLLGSNFANDDGLKEKATRGINGSSRSVVDSASSGASAMPNANLFYDPMGRREMLLWHAIVFEGFIAHSRYWVADQLDAESCFECFVPQLYPSS
jgi:hypothetical protein